MVNEKGLRVERVQDLEILKFSRKKKNFNSNILIVVHRVKTLHSLVIIRRSVLLRANTHAESHSGPSSLL